MKSELRFPDTGHLTYYSLPPALLHCISSAVQCSALNSAVQYSAAQCIEQCGV